jgi:hypothetical protein
LLLRALSGPQNVWPQLDPQEIEISNRARRSFRSKDSEADQKHRIGLALERVLTFERTIQVDFVWHLWHMPG